MIRECPLSDKGICLLEIANKCPYNNQGCKIPDMIFLPMFFYRMIYDRYLRDSKRDKKDSNTHQSLEHTEQ